MVLNILFDSGDFIMKQFLLIVISAVLVFYPNSVKALSVSAQYACVIDAETGRILFEKNAQSRHSMASTTKIMTALCALKNSNADEVVTVSRAAASVEGSSIYLATGEKISMKNLLYGLMLASGNDAAVAIAEHVSGSVEAFAELMNAEAKEAGAKNTSFKNPNGLDAEGHYTTAFDLALITRAALKNPVFSEIVKTKSFTLKESDVGYERYVTNHNKLLRLYEGCIGVKTGYTKKTGRCLVSAAERDKMKIIAVTLSAPDDWNDHIKMLDFAFTANEAKPLFKTDTVIKNISVENGSSPVLSLVPNENYYITVPKNEGLNSVRITYNIPEKLRAPVKKGSVVGSLNVLYNGEVLKQIELSAQSDVLYVEPPKPDFWDIFTKFLVWHKTTN